MFYTANHGFTADRYDDTSVEVSDDEHTALMTGQMNGKQIVVGSDGAPALADYPAEPLDSYTRSKSYDIRVGGTTINGMPVKTDADTLSLINGMAALAQADNTSTFAFDTGAATVTLTAQQAIGLSTAVGKWVQGTFTKRADVLGKIKAGTITTMDQVDAALVAASPAQPAPNPQAA